MLEYPAAEFFYESPDVVASVVVARRRTDPESRGELQSHRARLSRRSGQQALYPARAALQRAGQGEDRSCTASSASAALSAWTATARTARSTRSGCAIPVGMDFNPKDKSLWTNDNQVDGMGDDTAAGRTEPHRQRGARISASRGMAAARSAPTSTRTIRRPPTWFSRRWSRPRMRPISA